MAHHGRGGWDRDGWNTAGGAAGVVLGVVAAFAFLFVGVVILLVIAFAVTFDVETGPGKGTASQHLPVSVTPTAALQDGSVVRVRSSAFSASQVVGVAVCLTAADTKRLGVDACDTTTGARYAVGKDRRLDASYRVPRAITVDGSTYDCAQRSTGCMVVAASASDFDQSGGQRVSFAEPIGPPRPPPATRRTTDRLPIDVSPAGPLAPGADLRVTAGGFQPGEPVLVAVCGKEFAAAGDPTACRVRDADAAVVAVMFRNVGAVHDVADASGSYTTSVTIPVHAGSSRGERPRCSDAPGTCSVVVAAAADIKRSAVLPLTIAD